MPDAEDRSISDKYGPRVYTRDYKAMVIVVLNNDGSWDCAYDGDLLSALGLVKAASADLDNRVLRAIQEGDEAEESSEGDES